MAGEEAKILYDGIKLLFTSLAGGIVSLGVYVWVSSRKEHDRQMNKHEKRIESLEIKGQNHEGRLIHLETEHDNNTCGKRKRK